MNDHQQSAQGSQRFDSEALLYDKRTGISVRIAEQVATAIHEYTINTFGSSKSLSLLEIAAGTGELGHALHPFFHYSALEGSIEMLEQFKQRIGSSNWGLQQRLLLADANRTWPVENQTQDIVFIARAAHLLKPSHLINETKRCTRQSAILMLARVTKPKSSIANILKRELHRLLQDQSHHPKKGQQAHKNLINTLDESATKFTAANWTVSISPNQIIRSWRSKPGLAGVALSDIEQAEFLSELEGFAQQQFGDLDTYSEEQRAYEISCARIHQK